MHICSRKGGVRCAGSLKCWLCLLLSAAQYLIQDLFFTTVLAALMGYTAPRKELAGEKPPVRVMTVPLMTSTVLQLVVVVVFQLLALYTLSRQPDYVATIGASAPASSAVLFFRCYSEVHGFPTALPLLHQSQP